MYKNDGSNNSPQLIKIDAMIERETFFRSKFLEDLLDEMMSLRALVDHYLFYDKV